HVLAPVLGEARHFCRSRRWQVEPVIEDQVQSCPSSDVSSALRERTTPRLLKLRRSCKVNIVILVFSNPVNDRANLETTRPCIARSIIEDTEVSAIPWQRVGQSESRG